ncbi:MAG: hypothetical protein J5577_01630 [Bacteroidales bacterium]|nr:hypothetical protein [Bacteroidales bacterium]
MDAVITYVNGLDPVWQEAYCSRLGEDRNGKHFRDWGTLKYLLRGIEKHLPFIRNVYLVVSGESQVPEWADRSNLKIVFHSDIIPGRFLPVFNSTAIEMFLHRIPGLDEEFIYLNDDFFPVRDCRPEYFFRNGKASASFHRHLLASGMYKNHCRNDDRLAREAAGLAPSLLYLRPQHTCGAMLRSVCEELHAKEGKRIEESVSPVRSMANYNYYLFMDYAFHIGRTFPRKVSNRHFSTAVASSRKVCAFIADPKTDFVCINDVNMSEDRFRMFRDSLLEAFNKVFPDKSRFEL